MPTALFAAQQHHAFGAGPPFDPDVHYIHSHPDKSLYIITESDYVSALTTSQRTVCAKQPPTRYLGPSRRIALQQNNSTRSKDPRPLMAAVLQHANTMPLAAPGSPPDLTNSKSSKSSSFHSEGLSDMGPSDLSHFEDINLADDTGPSSFPVPHSPNRVLYEASRSRSIPHSAPHSFRDLTKGSKSRPAAMKIQTSHNLRAGSQLHAPAKQLRRGFSSPSAPSLANITNLQAPVRRSRSPSPNKPLPSSSSTSSQRSLSRKSSRNLEVSPSMASRRQSWQHTARKTAKEREAECDVDDGDDDLPEDAVIWNVPISPRPAQERSPAPSSCGSPPQTSPSPATSRPVSQRGELLSKTSSAFSERRYPSQSPAPDPNKENELPALSRQPTHTWEETYGALDADARKLTEALEEYQTEVEHQQEIKRQQPLSRSSSVGDSEAKKKKKAVPLPPVRKSDPLIDPFQPSTEKEKYLSRTRPSWLPPKDPKEEKKHLKEYQKMLARIEEAERLEAKRQEDEALAREKAERIKAEYWSSLLLPNWEQEMSSPELKGSHRKMWWNGIPAKLRGDVWKKAIGNELEVSEITYSVALEKAQLQVKELGASALNGRYAQIVENTKSVFPDLKMFAPETQELPEQPLHQELVNICVAYSSYRSDVDTTVGIHHVAALFLLNMSAADSFVALSNMMNRSLPLSFLLQDMIAITAAYDTTLSALRKKSPSMANRLTELRVEPHDYLLPMFSGLFCDRVSIEHAARIMDVYTIEGDKIPPRVAVALMGALEGNCMGGEAGDVVEVLKTRKLRESPDEFMGKVYEAGKSS
ncbi:TBC1 domain family member 14 [Paraphaeosphaeria sporulosa]